MEGGRGWGREKFSDCFWFPVAAEHCLQILRGSDDDDDTEEGRRRRVLFAYGSVGAAATRKSFRSICNVYSDLCSMRRLLAAPFSFPSLLTPFTPLPSLVFGELSLRRVDFGPRTTTRREEKHSHFQLQIIALYTNSNTTANPYPPRLTPDRMTSQFVSILGNRREGEKGRKSLRQKIDTYKVL